MSRLLLVFGIVLLSVSASAEPPKDTVTIPLDQIWAFDMPGTRDIRELEPERGPMVSSIGRSLSHAPAKGETVKPAFAVRGDGLQALRGAHAVLVEDAKPDSMFPVGSKLSVVFFSYQLGSFVHINNVERRGDVVEVQYRFVPHRTREMTVHFALIPLGELPHGKFTVQIIQSDSESGSKGLASRDWTHRVCGSSSFSVVVQEKP